MFLWWGYGVTKFDCVETIVRLNVLELIITTETSFLITMLDKRLRKEGHPHRVSVVCANYKVRFGTQAVAFRRKSRKNELK